MSRLLLLLIVLGLCAGCVQSGGRWGGVLPDGQRLRSAFGEAAMAPGTWAPLLGAAALTIDNADNRLAEWAVDKTPLFGSDAADWSNDLLDFTTAAYLLTALAAPSARGRDKATGLSVGIATMALEGGLSEALKSAVGRERPNGRNDRSFPSGHASQSASRATLAAANLAYMDLAPWQRRSLSLLFQGAAAGTAWARVEAEKHHPADVLAGYALGHFLATFMNAAFLQEAGSGRFTISVQPDGAALTWSAPLRP